MADDFGLNGFDQLDASTQEVAPLADSAKDKNAEKKKARMALYTDAMKQTVAADPTVVERMHSLSKSLRVENVFGFGDKGNLIAVPSKDPNKKRGLEAVSQNVGYRVKNIGDKPIEMNTTNWKNRGDGVFVQDGIVAVKVLPGKSIDLARSMFVANCARTEISFLLENGKVVPSSATYSNMGNSIEKYLDSHYFAFSDGSNVNDTTKIKINIAQQDKAGKWTVKPEFEKTFGFLNNPAETAERKTRQSTKPQVTAQALCANYVLQVLNQKADLPTGK